MLVSRAETTPDRLAYTYLHDGRAHEESVTYLELHARASAIAARLRERLDRRARVLLLFPPGIDYVSAVFGCFEAGMIGVSAAPPQPKRLHRTLPRLVAIANDAEVGGVLTTQAIKDAAAALLGADQPLGRACWIALDEPAGQAAPEHEVARVDPSEVAFMQYTSGSTSDPRGVLLTHANLLANSAFIERAFGHSTDSKGFIWLPPYHDMGLIGGVLQPLYVGFPCVLVSPITVVKRPVRWLEGISAHRATTSGGPNFAYDLCIRRVEPEARERLDLSSWEVAFNGAEPIHAHTIESFSEAFASCGFRRRAFFPCYGLAEATLMVTAPSKEEEPALRRLDAAALEDGRAAEADPDARAVTLVGCGASDERHEVEIVDPVELRRCAPHQVGEIWMRGPSVAAGYWRRERETAETFSARIDGEPERAYLRTGDLGVVEDGELFVVGRLKETLIVGGRNLYPHDIELSAESAHPALRPHCSAAFGAEVDGTEAIVAVLELAGGDQHDAAEIMSRVRMQVAQDLDVQVRRIVLCRPQAVPKTTSGKIQRQLCRTLLERGELEVVADSRPRGPVPHDSSA